MKKIIFYALLFSPCLIYSQAYSPRFKTSYTINNNSAQTLSNYQVLIILNTGTPILDGHMQLDGDDIRFTADSCNPAIHYDYWIDQNLNSDSTKIWVKIPELLPFSNTSFLIWYGDSIVNGISSFNATFPNAFISNGIDTSLYGSLTYDWFELELNDTINLVPNSPLDIHARIIIVDGVIIGKGKGYLAPGLIGNGGGPGGGGMSNSAGAGGGSYGGMGGDGGFDDGDTPGIGGPIYGQENDFTSFMGSAGGTTDNAIGGNGGGSLELNAEFIKIKGQIDISGNVGIGSIGRCGGGGSGGTILLMGSNVQIDSTAIFNASGGDGGSGSSTANDGGGGGSGGRIKLFHGTQWSSFASVSLLGGNGGLFGSGGFGEDGSLGTYFDSTITFSYPFIENLASETALSAEILNLDSVYCLNKDSILLEAVPVGGIFTGPGVISNYFNPLTAGIGVHTISYVYSDPTGCGNLYDSVEVEVLNIPTFPMATNNSPLCEGELLNLTASDSSAAHLWTGPNGFSSSLQFPNLSNVNELNTGNYTVTITDASGCTSSATTSVTVHPSPIASANNNGPICLDQDLIFMASGGSSYSWNGPNGFSSFSQSPTVVHSQFVAQGIYTVTITGLGGCETTITTEVIVNGCYENIENPHVNEISIFPNPAHAEIWIETPLENYSPDRIVKIYDISGKVVLQQVIIPHLDRQNINIESLSPGSYTVSVQNGISTKTFKLIHY